MKTPLARWRDRLRCPNLAARVSDLVKREPQLDIDDLYRRYGGLVLCRVRRFYPDEEARDVMQEVFARAIEKRDTFRGESSPGTWLYQLTTRYCLNRLRDAKRRKELLDQQEPDAWWSPSASAARQERDVLVKQLWRVLDEDLALIGVYYYVDGMSHAEIAEIVGVSRRTVGNRVAEIERRVRALAGGA